MHLKTCVKVANLVLEALATHRFADPFAENRRFAVSDFERLLQLCRRIEKCHNRFPAARAHLESEIASAASDCRFRLESLPRRPSRQRKPPSMRELAGELQALETEFEEWVFDAGEQTLSVETEPIELEGVVLGPFRIALSLRKLSTMDTRNVYKVFALEPNPPTCNESVTHPHVRDNLLCEGDASAAITAALLDGRLCDFFLLVQSVLRTYNPGSPYVKIEEWDGVPCHECSYVVPDGNQLQCQGCENDFCHDCVSECTQCGSVLCHSCLGVCDICEQELCDGCREKCSKCGETYCGSCVKDGICVTCKEKADEEAEVEETLV